MWEKSTAEHNSKYHKSLRQYNKISKMKIIRILSSVRTVCWCSSSFEVSFALVSISSNSLSTHSLSKAAILKKTEARNSGNKDNWPQSPTAHDNRRLGESLKHNEVMPFFKKSSKPPKRRLDAGNTTLSKSNLSLSGTGEVGDSINNALVKLKLGRHELMFQDGEWIAG